MVCDAPKGPKLQENGPFYRIVWPGLIAGVSEKSQQCGPSVKPGSQRTKAKDIIKVVKYQEILSESD